MIRTTDILDAIPEGAEMSAKEIAIKFPVPERHIYARLAAIHKAGKIHRTGTRRRYRYGKPGTA